MSIFGKLTYKFSDRNISLLRVLPLEIKCIINTIDQKLISKSSTNVSVFLDFDGKEFFIQTKMFSLD